MTKKDVDGAEYNVEVNDKRYLIQKNWDPVLQACAIDDKNT